MKNKQIDLHNMLFAQLERLSDEELKGDELKAEVKRAHAITSVSREIILNGKLALQAQIAVRDGRAEKMPEMLKDKSDEL